jgi:ElaB/YqjD/DUF883 family membrane-anchored ribosome-binding protein
VADVSPDSSPKAGPAATDPEQLRHDIEATRNALADTVEALAFKADIKARSQDRARELQTQLTEKAREVSAQAATRVPRTSEDAREQARQLGGALRERPGVAVTVVLAVLGLLIVRGRRRRKKVGP